MAITKRPTSSTADGFIKAAPDAGSTRVRKGNKVQISLTIAEPILDRLDAKAAELGQSRAAFINLAIYQMLESGLRVEK
jgi:hypothetical protein